MRLRNDLILRQMGSDFVIVDPSQDVVDMSKVFTLNETATYIWKELEGIDFSLDDVAKIITNHYEVSEEQALVDTKILLEQLRIEGLLEEY